MRAPVRVFLAFAALAVAGWAVQRIRTGGLSAPEVEAHYLGVGGEPLGAAALWEEVHMGAFVLGFVLFMLGALLAVSPVPDRVRSWLVGGAAAAALADLFAPFAVVALGRGGGLRVATFALALATTAALFAVVALRFGAEGRDG
jgi:hypothetical protein